MKIVISALVVILLMIDAPSMQSVFGIFYDSHGRVCNFGAAHDECQYEFPEKIPGTSNYADYHSGYKVGYPDGLTEGVYHHSKAEDNRTASWSDGYYNGWNQGCVDSGRIQDDCDSQADVSTP